MAVSVACAQVLEKRHAKPQASVPPGFLGDVNEGYNCWGGDIAEVVIHVNYSLDEEHKHIMMATCRTACMSDIGCKAWTLNLGSGAQGNGHCWLKHSCENGDNDPYTVSGFVDHKNLVQLVQAPNKVDTADLAGVMHNTNCWGRDIAEVVINSSGNATRDELIFACRSACVADGACAAWTLNHGLNGMQGQGNCWLKSSCAGRMYDTRAEAGIVTRNPGNTVSRQADANGNSPAETGTGVVVGNRTKNGAGSGAANGTRRDAGSTMESTASVADSSHERESSTTSSSSVGTSAAASGAGNSANTTGGGAGGYNSSSPGNGTGNDSGTPRNDPSEMRFLQHGDPAASPPQPPPWRGEDGNIPGLSKTDKDIIGSVVGVSTGALAVGLLAGLWHPTSPQPTSGQVQLPPTLAAIGVSSAGAKSRAPTAANAETPSTRSWTAVDAGLANDTRYMELEEVSEEDSPLKQCWGWIFLVSPFWMATLCCFAVFILKVNAAGTSKHNSSRWYSPVGSETDIDEGMSSDSLSP
jgi:hypothetical protein